MTVLDLQQQQQQQQVPIATTPKYSLFGKDYPLHLDLQAIMQPTSIVTKRPSITPASAAMSAAGVILPPPGFRSATPILMTHPLDKEQEEEKSNLDDCTGRIGTLTIDTLQVASRTTSPMLESGSSTPNSTTSSNLSTSSTSAPSSRSSSRKGSFSGSTNFSIRILDQPQQVFTSTAPVIPVAPVPSPSLMTNPPQLSIRTITQTSRVEPSPRRSTKRSQQRSRYHGYNNGRQ